MIATIAAVAGLLVAALMGQSTEGQLGWGFLAFLGAALMTFATRSNDSRRSVGDWTERVPRSHPTAGSSAAVSRPKAVAKQTDGAIRLGRFDRLGLTKAARERREAAKLATESAAAWAQLADEARFAQNRISVVRRSCERFVDGAKATPFDTAALAHLVVVQKRVPEMIRRRLDLCSKAGPVDRRRLLDDLIHQLECIAAEGERRSSSHDFIPLEELQTEKAYLQAHFSTFASSARQGPEAK